MRARAPALLAEGRLDRAIRVLQRAEDLCPPEAPATWALRVGALAAVGRSAEAVQLASRIDRSDRANDEDRRASAAARRIAEAHGRALAEGSGRREAPELFDPSEKARAAAAVLFHRGAAASRAGDHAAAKKLFLDAWETWHPDPRALVEAGLEARASGSAAEAQALWDRAAFDDPNAALRPELVAGAPSIVGGAAIAWSADGTRIAVGGDDEVAVFDADLRGTLRLRTSEIVRALAFAGDGLLCAGLDAGVVRVIDTRTGATRDLEGHAGAVRTIEASSDGRTIASAGVDGTVRIWDAVAGLSLHTLHPPRGASRLAFDASGAQLASAGDDGRIAIWDARTGALATTLAARGGAIQAMAFERGGALDVVTAGERVRWEIGGRGDARATSTHARAEVASIRVGGDDRAVTAAVAGPELAIAAGDASLASIASADHGGVAALALSPGGRALATVHRDRTIAIVSAAERRERRAIGPSGPVDAIAASPDGEAIAAAADGRVLVWRVTGERLRAQEPGGARAVALSPDGRTIAMGLDRGRIVVRDLRGERADRTLDAAGAVAHVAFSDDGAYLAAGTAAPSVQLFAASSTRELRLEGPVRAVRFAPKGGPLLIASREGVMLWAPHDGEQSDARPVRFDAFGSDTRDAAFTSDGIAVADRHGQLLLGRPSTSKPMPPITVPISAQILVLDVAADATIITAQSDRSIAIRSPAGKVMHRFRDPDAAVHAIAALGGHVAAGLGDGSVRLYRAPETGPIAILRGIYGPRGELSGGVISGPRGHYEIVGPDVEAARARLRCRLGAVLYPLEVCAEQYAVSEMLKTVLSGKDPAEADP